MSRKKIPTPTQEEIDAVRSQIKLDRPVSIEGGSVWCSIGQNDYRLQRVEKQATQNPTFVIAWESKRAVGATLMALKDFAWAAYFDAIENAKHASQSAAAKKREARAKAKKSQMPLFPHPRSA